MRPTCSRDWDRLLVVAAEKAVDPAGHKGPVWWLDIAHSVDSRLRWRIQSASSRWPILSSVERVQTMAGALIVGPASAQSEDSRLRQSERSICADWATSRWRPVAFWRETSCGSTSTAWRRCPTGPVGRTLMFPCKRAGSRGGAQHRRHFAEQHFPDLDCRRNLHSHGALRCQRRWLHRHRPRSASSLS